MNDQITIVTPTIGSSALHLRQQMADLRRFTNGTFRQIVCDDGTLDETATKHQRDVVLSYPNAEWYANPGPTWGISYNLNHAMEQVGTPWAFVIEDGVRASAGWFETALDAVNRIGGYRWGGFQVGAIGTFHIQEWMLAMANVLRMDGTVMDAVHHTYESYQAFWNLDDSKYCLWNDGYWNWNRLLPGLLASILTEEAMTWPRGLGPGDTRDYLFSKGGEEACYAVLERRTAQQPYNPSWNRDVNNPFDIAYDTWPANRKAVVAFGASPFVLLNMDAWRACGRFRDGCTFFEGHLGVRMAQHGYLWLSAQFPPWLHYAGMGFVASNTRCAVPRHHEPCDGPDSILVKDFGCNGENHKDLFGPGGLCDQAMPPSVMEEVNKDLANVELWMEDGWKRWV